MKVLLINNFHYHKGGSEAVYFNTAELLKKEGHKVVFFSIRREENDPCEQEIYFAKKSSPFSKIRNYFNNPNAAKQLAKLLEVEKPDIAHVHLFWGGITPSIFKVLKKYDVPVVHTAHDYRMVCPAYTFRNGRGNVCEHCKGGRFEQCIKYRCSKGSIVQSIIMALEMKYRNIKWHPAKELDGIIYVSEFSKQKHEEMDPLFAKTKNIVLYNTTSIGKLYPMKEKDSGYYLFYGRLSKEKGVASLVEAFIKLSGLRLKIIGTGPNEKELKQNMYPNIEFLGYKKGDDLFNLVRNARFVIIPSEWYENNPMTIIEAYTLGVPVIGARIGGIPEIVEHGKTGFLFESRNVNALVEAIKCSFILDDKEYVIMKTNAKTFADINFNSDIYVNRLLDFYKETLVSINKC